VQPAAHAALYEAIVEASPSGIVLIDASGRVAFANVEAERIFGYGKGEMLGGPVDQLVPVTGRAAHVAQREALVASNGIRRVGKGRDLQASRRDGSHFWVEVSLGTISVDGGALVVAVVTDVTERKLAELELAAQRDALVRSNAALEEFASIASHDMEEPVRVMASFAELLIQRYRGRFDDTANKYLDYIVEGGRRMQRLLADVLAHSRVGTGSVDLEEVSLEAAFASVVGDLEGSIVRAGAVVTRDPLPNVIGDGLLLRVLFQNLLSNALKFRGEAAPVVHVSSRTEGSVVRIAVSDRGIGIRPRDADRVFQMFQRLHDRGKYEGSGIGLATVKRIVEHHGGRVGFESRPGEGTTIHFTLRGAPPSA
jgi:PAS domain S-box-containing protein